MSLFVKDKDFYSRFWRLTITIALQNVVVYAVNLADNVMLGRYTQDALSGVALCNQIFFIIQMMVTGIGEGLLVFAARSWGERDIPAVWRITNIAMKLAAGASLVSPTTAASTCASLTPSSSASAEAGHVATTMASAVTIETNALVDLFIFGSPCSRARFQRALS